jgi:hypothetical protein
LFRFWPAANLAQAERAGFAGPAAARRGDRGEQASGVYSMISLTKQNRPWLGSGLLALLGILGFPLGTLRGDDARSLQEIDAINFEWEQAMIKDANARRNAKSPIELERVQKDFATTEHRFVERCMDLARKEPDSIVGLIALKLVAGRSPKTEEGKKAAEALVKQAASADLDVLAKALPAMDTEDPTHLVVPIILDRVKKNPGHAQAARLLASVACGSADPDALKPPAEFIEAADLIVERYADSPHIRNFCELNGCRWAGPFEKHLRTILDRNQHRDVRAAASFAGVNGDDDQQAAKAVAADHRMTWRSFRNRSGAQTISLDWHLWGWPTFYLIDQKGMIRKRWRNTRPEELNHAIDQLIVAQTESKTAK